MEPTKRSTLYDTDDLDDDARPVTCPNCGTERQGPYCHDCGQRYLQARLSAAELGWIFADRFLDWEEGVWRTFLQMAVSPGVVIRHYLDGRRRTYLNPFSYLLFCVGLYAVARFVLIRIAGAASVPGIGSWAEWGGALNNAEDEFTLIAYGTVGAVTLLAVAMRVMFDGRLLNAMEAVVAALYASGNVFLLSILVSLGEFLLTGDPLSIPGLIGAGVVLFPLCMFHAGYGLFESWGWAGYTGLAPVLAGLIGGLLVMVLGVAIMPAFGTGGVVATLGILAFFFIGPLLVLGLKAVEWLR
jgi:hypothetical protein